MVHQVLSRKYRPQVFDELVGQAHVGRILQNALLSDRVGHAYLFVGPRGVGKTTTARIFAKALNCSGREGDASSPEPCGVCPSCRDITAGSDLDVVEMDAASNNHVEDVRRLREQVGYSTVRSRYRIWIVDEVHMLSMPAFNAFLKTLEEPPERVKFVFCTTEEHKLPETFRSRCQRIEFRPIDEAAMADRLRDLARRESVEMEDGLPEEIAAAALGGLRDAESLLEQLIAACPEERLRRSDLDALAGRAPRALLEGLGEAVDTGDAGAALDAMDAALATGCKPGVLLEQWLEALRCDLVDAARSGAGGGGETRSPSVARVARSIDVLLQKRMHLRAGTDGTLVCQVAAVELARLPDARDLDQLIDAFRRGSPGAGGGGDARSRTKVRETARETARETVRETPTPRSDAVRRTPPGTRNDSAPAPSAGGVDLVSQWKAVVGRAQEEDGRLAEALCRVRPGRVADGVVELHAPAGDVLARSTLERREAIRLFRHVTRDVLGETLAPRVVLDPVSDSAPDATHPPRETMEEHPAVRLVRETTGGRLLDLERKKGPASERSPQSGREGRDDA